MASKREFVNYQNALDLKSAMIAKSAYPKIAEFQSYYDGAANDIHETIGQYEDGSYKTINITANGVSGDFIENSDTTLVRRWTKREMDVYLDSIGSISRSDYIFNGTNYIYTIIYNGQTETGTAPTIPNAMAKALIKIINLQTFSFGLKK